MMGAQRKRLSCQNQPSRVRIWKRIIENLSLLEWRSLKASDQRWPIAKPLNFLHGDACDEINVWKTATGVKLDYGRKWAKEIHSTVVTVVYLNSALKKWLK